MAESLSPVPEDETRSPNFNFDPTDSPEDLDAKLASKLRWIAHEIDTDIQSTKKEFAPIEPYVPLARVEEPTPWFWVFALAAGGAALLGFLSAFHS